MQRIKNSTASLTGITLYMQPVQDLTIEGTVSRTQYQFILQDADPAQLAEWTPKLVDKLNQLPQLADVASDISAPGALGLRRDRPRPGRPFRHYAGDDRQCAVRLLRPAHRLHHLHQLQPVPRHPRSRSEPADLAAIAVRYLSALLGRQRAGAAGRDGQDAGGNRAAAGLASRAVSRSHRILQPGAGRIARRGGDGDQAGASRDRPAAQRDHQLSGRRAGVSVIALQSAFPDPGGDRHRLYRAGRAL